MSQTINEDLYVATRIGIGTQNPSAAQLEIEGQSAGFDLVCHQGNSTRWRVLANPNFEIGTVDTAGSFGSFVGLSPTRDIYISGNVGIGTFNPTAKLEINNGDLLLKAYGEDPGDIIFQNSAGVQKARIWSQPAAGSGLFLSSGDNNPDISITQSGSVGIGTTAPGANARLNVVGGAIAVAAIPYTADAAIHIRSSFGGFDRLLQMSPDRPSKPGLNLVASMGAAGNEQWWAWGVTTDHKWRIHSGTVLDGTDGLTINTSGYVGIGTINPQEKLHVDGSILVTQDVILEGGADCAEDFDVLGAEAIEPGTVMVIDQDGQLRVSTEAYDRKVAGVVSGAGDFKPGMVLDRQSEQKNRMPIALMGKVYCKVDAQFGAIEVGDLLTTSPTPGHAMKAIDPSKVFGAVIGKALKSLEAGTGLIPIIVALQ